MHLSTILGPFKYDHEKYRYFLEIVVLDTPLPYLGVPVGTVTHKQGPRR